MHFITEHWAIWFTPEIIISAFNDSHSQKKIIVNCILCSFIDRAVNKRKYNCVNPILDFRLIILCHAQHTIPLDYEKVWTGELWSNTNLLKGIVQ